MNRAPAPLRLCLGCRKPGEWGREGRCNGCRLGRQRRKDADPNRRAQKAKYNSQHRAMRREWQPVVEAGLECWRPDCDTQLDPRNWHLGHRRNLPSMPECPTCNLEHANETRTK